MTTKTEAKLLARAAEILGSVEQLALRLKVPLSALTRWTQGQGEVPGDVFLRAIDLYMDAVQERSDDVAGQFLLGRGKADGHSSLG